MKLLILLLFLPAVSLAAVPERSSNHKKTDVLKALQAPQNYAVQEIFSLGPVGYKELYTISFSKTYPMPLRWKAFMVMIKIGKDKSLPEINKALNSGEWFMRSAGLLAMETIDKKSAMSWAKKFFTQDKAMMVRAKAIDVLRNNPSKSMRKLMWKKLYSKENYHRNKGLWIRKKILSFLADYGDQSDLKRFKKTLFDRDPRLYPVAMGGLERITGKKPATGLTAKAQLTFWKKQL